MSRKSFSICTVAVFGSLAMATVFLQSGDAEETTPKSQVKGEAAFSKEQLDFFDKKVQPILKARCLKCHGGEEKINGGLKLTSRASLLKGGDQGPAVLL